MSSRTISLSHISSFLLVEVDEGAEYEENHSEVAKAGHFDKSLILSLHHN